MANKDAVSVARFWRDVELKSLYSFPSTKMHCNLNNKQLPTLLCKQEKGQRSDNQQARQSNGNEEAAQYLGILVWFMGYGIFRACPTHHGLHL